MSATAPDALPRRLFDRARALVMAERAEEALPMLDRLAVLPGQAADAAALRAEALLQLRRAGEAEDAADAALASTPDHAGRRQLRARIRLARGDRTGAIDDAAAAVMAGPNDPYAKALLGTALLEDHRLDEAIWFLGEAFRAQPHDPALQSRLGQAFMQAGKHEAAAELLGHCEAQTPNHPGITALRAQNLLLAGDAAGAADLARAAIAAGKVEAALQSMLAHALVQIGQLEAAGPHFAAAARLAPHDGYLSHLAAAAANGTTPPPQRAPESYVTTLFDGYAANFESSLIALGYRVPGLIRQMVEAVRPDIAAGTARLGPVLDLGCGTGLAAVALCDWLGGPVTGIDLSRAMLEQAQAKGLYSRLIRGDLLQTPADLAASQDLVLAADVFCYLGRLEDALLVARETLGAGGLLVFSVELAAPGEGWRLRREGRFAHAPDYIAACLASTGLAPVLQRTETLRHAADGGVQGMLVAARAVAH